MLCGGPDAGLLRVGLGQVRIRSLPKVDAQKGLIFSLGTYHCDKRLVLFSKLLSTTELSGEKALQTDVSGFLHCSV